MRLMHGDTLPARLPPCSGDEPSIGVERGVDLDRGRGIAPVATAC